MTPLQYLQLLYPWYFVTTDLRFVPEATMTGYLQVAGGYRPTCLPDERQNEAQAHYAAYLADEVFRSSLLTDNSIVSLPRVVKREKEYNVEVEYEYALGKINAGGVAMAPMSPYQSWYALWKKCRVGGSITVSNAYPCTRNRDS